MYRAENFVNKITMKVFLENYVDVTGFLEYCKQCRCYGRVWSCPPYDFKPEEYWGRYKYIHIIGTKIIFDQATIDVEREKEEIENYIDQVFLKEKKILSERMQTLEKKYPGSIGLFAGSCHICTGCARPGGEACRYPDEMRYSIESLGGNVGKTARELLGIELIWMEEKLPEYITLVNGFLTDDPEAEI